MQNISDILIKGEKVKKYLVKNIYTFIVSFQLYAETAVSVDFSLRRTTKARLNCSA